MHQKPHSTINKLFFIFSLFFFHNVAISLWSQRPDSSERILHLWLHFLVLVASSLLPSDIVLLLTSTDRSSLYRRYTGSSPPWRLRPSCLYPPERDPCEEHVTLPPCLLPDLQYFSSMPAPVLGDAIHTLMPLQAPWPPKPSTSSIPVA